jgi:hypothetical protein
MDLSPSSEAASCLATQQFPKILRKPNVHYRDHKNPSLVPTSSQNVLLLASLKNYRQTWNILQELMAAKVLNLKDVFVTILYLRGDKVVTENHLI